MKSDTNVRYKKMCAKCLLTKGLVRLIITKMESGGQEMSGMDMPDRDTVLRLRREYPRGTRVLDNEKFLPSFSPW